MTTTTAPETEAGDQRRIDLASLVWFRRGREHGAADRLLGVRSSSAEDSLLPGYAEGYREGIAGR